MSYRSMQPTRRAHVGKANRAFLLVCVVLGLLGVVYYCYTLADPERFDPSPLPRTPINAPFITTSNKVVDKMIEVAELTAEDVVCDLGCGDGRIVIAAAKASGCQAIGYDIDPELVQLARQLAKDNGVEHLVTIEERDIFTADLSQFTVVMTYLLPWMMEKLIPQFDEMRPGTKIVAHDFPVPGCAPDETYEVPSGNIIDPDHVHVWILPLKKGTALK